mgnify:CR=1 FL=1
MQEVDILLTTYNTETEYLKQQIESIVNQTYQNFRLLISDDASTKKDVKTILEEYQKKDKRITLYQQEKNLGYNKNFEFLLKQANAKYIMFSDHDDIWYPQKIEKSLQKIKKERVDLVYCNAHQINEKGETIQTNYFQYKNVPLVQGKDKLAISRCVGIGCSQIITDNVKDKMIPFRDEVIAHDWLAAFIANEGKGIAYIEEPLFGYRLHTNNVFGGRSLAQNLSQWKKENGTSYQSYLKYRKEKVIDKAYLEGAKMCLAYAKDEENKKFLKNMIQYYKSLEKSKYVNIHIFQYFRFLAGKNLAKKMMKEWMIFHLPILGYLIYLI